MNAHPLVVGLALVLCLGAGTVGGVFFAFSTFVMKALGDLPPALAVTAMQRINVVVINPLFLAPFFGTAALSLAAIAVSLPPWSSASAPLLTAAGLLYAAGCFGITLAFNVPRNDRLARFDADSAEAAMYWSTYLREWTRWNTVRTVAALAAAACAAGALVA